MIRNCSRNFHLGRLVLALLLFGPLAPSALAQQASAPASAAPGLYGHAVRVDVGGILARNLASAALGNSGMVLPLLVGYEQQLAPRVSGNVELLVNGGSMEERSWGLAAQGRYYYYQGRQTGLAGLYVAPTLSYRGIRQAPFYNPQVVQRKLGGGGVLLGAQLPLGAQRRFLLDVSGGIMAWKRLNKDPRAGYSGTYNDKTYYENNSSVFDGRLSLGYRF